MFVEKFLLLFFPCEAHTNYTPPMCPQSECYLVVYSGHYNLTGRVSLPVVLQDKFLA